MINTLYSIPAEGISLPVLIRGENPANPVLLVLPAGPGFPVIPEARYLGCTLGLEKYFTMAYLDPRGCGKSYSASMDPGLYSIEQYIGDTGKVMQFLQQKFPNRKLFLMGFSIGGSFAMIAARMYPDLLNGVIAVGPDIDMAAAEEHAYTFILQQAEAEQNRKALQDMKRIGMPPHISVSAFQTRVRWVTEFGGIQRGQNFRQVLIRTLKSIFTCSSYSLTEKIAALRAIGITQKYMLPVLQNFRLKEYVPDISVPVRILQGKLDAAAPYTEAEKYIAGLHTSGTKRIILFENSAHNPHYDEPEKFRNAVLSCLQ